MRMRPYLVAPALVSAFACGLVASRFMVRDAQAQSSYLASTVYVPSDGLAFRAFDGHVVAKLSYDAHGGVFEIFDEHERIAASVRGGGVMPVGAARDESHAVQAAKPTREDLGF